MRPDFSVLFLTTLIGTGQGLLFALVFTLWLALFAMLPGQEARAFHATGALIALVLTGLGLFASFFHLGRPERGWRAIARWRTSWLSREVIVLPAFMAATFAYAAASYFAAEPLAAPRSLFDAQLVLGTLAALLALALFVCTGMIYACLPFLREWHSPLTVVNFMLLGGSSGFMVAAALATLAASGIARFLALCALVLTLAGLVTRSASLIRNARLGPKSTLQTAIGIKHPRITQTAMGFLGGSFNTREFFHGRPREVVRAVKWGFLVAAFAAPALLVSAYLAGAATGVLAAAAIVQYLGLLAERWYFFAQANHPQNLYYQAIG